MSETAIEEHRIRARRDHTHRVGGCNFCDRRPSIVIVLTGNQVEMRICEACRRDMNAQLR